MNSGRCMPIAGEARMSRGRRERGHAAVETALMSPWIFLLFIAVFDLGFYSYAVIATQNAARSAVMYTSRGETYAGDTAGACDRAWRELQGLPNVGPVAVGSPATCAASVGTISDATPVAVVATGPYADPAGGGGLAASVAVTYRSPQLFPLPGLMGRMTVTRVAEARVRDN